MRLRTPIWLLLIAIFLLVFGTAISAATTRSGGQVQKQAQQVAIQTSVGVVDTLSVTDETRLMRHATRSFIRTPIHRSVYHHVTCWNGKVVIDRPGIQDCPSKPKPHFPANASEWANQPFSIRVANCESGGGPSDTSATYDGDPHLYDPNGHYGKWQFDYGTWAEVGGSGNPADASEAEQDYRAWLLWKANGWSRWECAHLV